MPKDLTDVDEFTDPISVPVDSDPRNAASVETPFQGLANRTRNLKGIIDPDSPVLRTIMIPLSSAQNIYNGTSLRISHTSSGGEIISEVNTNVDQIRFPLYLPSGAEVDRVRMGAERSTTNAVEVHLVRITPDKATPAAGSRVEVATGSSTTSGAVIVDTGSGIGEVIDNEDHEYFIGATVQQDGGSIYWVELSFWDHGPRSH